MTDAPVEMQPWSRQRWWLAIAFVFAFQIALIFLLEKHSAGVQHKTVAVPRVQLQPGAVLENFLVNDPTVFVLPHPNGFSGEAWLNNFSPMNFQPADWTEPPRVLRLDAAALGAHFREFTAYNPTSQLENIPSVQPAPTIPPLDRVKFSMAKSTLKITGPLAQRRLLAAPQLPVWESAEPLTNSVVQALVDADGKTISAVLLSAGVKLPKQIEADTLALELAKAAEFEPVPTGTATVGILTFEWQTVPPAATDGPLPIP